MRPTVLVLAIQTVQGETLVVVFSFILRILPQHKICLALFVLQQWLTQKHPARVPELLATFFFGLRSMNAKLATLPVIYKFSRYTSF